VEDYLTAWISGNGGNSDLHVSWRSRPFELCLHHLPCSEWKDPAIFEEFEHLVRLTGKLDRERGGEVPTHHLLRQVMEAETIRDEESPTRE